MPLLSHLGVSIEMVSKGPTKRQVPSVTKSRRKVLFSATVDVHILSFHIPYLKMLQGMNYETHVATNGQAEIPHCDVRHTVPFARSPIKLSNLRAIKQLRQIIEAEKFDLIHTHTPMGAVVTRLAAMRARKMYGTKVIYTAHGFHFYKGAPWHYWMIFYPVEKLLARVTDMLITINQEDYQLAKKRFRTDVQYVPGVGIDPAKFDKRMTKADKTKIRKSLGLKDTDFVMLYPAELNKNKNQTMLIIVMEKLVGKYPNIHLLLPGKDSLEGYHRDLVDHKGLSKNIHLLGYRADIPLLFKAANLSVSASYREGLPVHIIEAMMAGLPVVSTQCRGAKELIADGENGYLVHINDTDSMAGKIVAIMDGSDVTDKLGAKSFDMAQRYTIDGVAKEMRHLYGAFV